MLENGNRKGWFEDHALRFLLYGKEWLNAILYIFFCGKMAEESAWILLMVKVFTTSITPWCKEFLQPF